MNEEIEALLKMAMDSIRGARLLFDDELYGFAVSRAYYAMFYLVSAVLLTKGLNFSKHQAVVAAFGQHFVKTGIFKHMFHQRESILKKPNNTPKQMKIAQYLSH